MSKKIIQTLQYVLTFDLITKYAWLIKCNKRTKKKYNTSFSTAWRHKKNFRKIRKLVESLGEQAWIGINYSNKEGKWKFITDNTEFDPNEDGTLFRWSKGKPRLERDFNCALVYKAFSTGPLESRLFLSDFFCVGHASYGLCEIKNF